MIYDGPKISDCTAMFYYVFSSSHSFFIFSININIQQQVN